MLLRNLVCSACFAVLAACAGSQSAPAPDAAPGADGPLTLEQAQGVVAQFAAAQGYEPGEDGLMQPRSVEDVLAILKRDQLDLFQYGVSYLEQQPEQAGKSLHAQLELAWGEAANMTGEALIESASRLERRAALQRQEGGAEMAAELEAKAEEYSAAADALLVIGAEHIKRGGALAEAVIAAAPDDYRGYRVAADYYRLNHKWDEFNQVVAKIEEIKPESNGLVFLKGAAAAQRDFDFRKAAGFYRQALEKDPQFTRAQMVLVLGQEDLGQLYAEFQKLKALNPQHHLVVWTGATLEADYQDWQTRGSAEGSN